MTPGRDGALYGETFEGGPTGKGTLYKLTTDGKFTTLHNFGKRAYGVLPNAGLTAGPDGNFYGTTVDGGDTTSGNGFGYGTVFFMTTEGIVTILYRFHPDTNGSRPSGVVFGRMGRSTARQVRMAQQKGSAPFLS